MYSRLMVLKGQVMLVCMLAAFCLTGIVSAADLPLKVYYNPFGKGKAPADTEPGRIPGPWHGLDTLHTHQSGTQWGGSPLTVGDITVRTDSCQGEGGDSVENWLSPWSANGQWQTGGQVYPMLDLAQGPENGSHSNPWLELIFEGLTAGAEYELTIYHNNPINDWGSSVSISGSGGGTGSGTGTNGSVTKRATTFETAGQTSWIWISDGSDATFKTSFGGGGPWQNGFILRTPNPTVALVSASSAALEAVSPAQFEVTLGTTDPAETYTVDYAAVGGTATAGDDYVLADGTLTFAAGEMSKIISMEIIDDGLNEQDETVILKLSNPTGADLQIVFPNEHVYTIVDPRPAISFEKDRGSGWEDTSAVSIPVNISEPRNETITVGYVVGGTATSPDDYSVLGPGTLTFEPGQTTQTIDLAIVDDDVDEADETVLITLINLDDVKLGAITEYTYKIRDWSSFHLKVDLGYMGRDEHLTVKDGWAPWASDRWCDLYMHDGDGIRNIDGSGIDAFITGVCEGRSGLKVNGMCMCHKAGGCCAAEGNPQGDPIANSWFTSVDRCSNAEGSMQLGLYNLPQGEYELTMYHNLWEPCGGGSRECTGCEYSWDPIVQIHVLSLDQAQARIGTLPGWNQGPATDAHNKMRGFAGPDPGSTVMAIEEAYNVEQSTVTSDADVATSLVKFLTDGSPVILICEVGPGESDQYVGDRAAINAFEVKLAGASQESCACPGDLNTDDQVDLEDLQAVADILLDAGSPFIVQVEPGHCADISADEQVDLEDLQLVAGILLDAGSPFIVSCE